MQPDPTTLIEKAGLTLPLICSYNAPDPAPFTPLVEPVPGKWACVFMYYKRWLKGETLHLTADNYGCGGAGYWLHAVQTRTREEFIKFLAEEEGLSTPDRMAQWLDHQKPNKPQYPHILIGPLKADQYPYLKSVTFMLTPDQLSLFIYGANYHSVPNDPEPILARFGSGCSQLYGRFDNPDFAQAAIAGTDVAMRRFMPADIILFSVTRSMFERLCSLDERTFLFKPFWQELRKARGQSQT